MSSLSIEEINSYQLTDDFYERPDVHALMSTYQLNPTSLTDLARLRLGPPAEGFYPKSLFVAMMGERIIGHLCIEHFQDRSGQRATGVHNGQHYDVVPFWNRLDASFQDAIRPYVNTTVYMAGISVIPEFKKEGIGHVLYAFMLSRYNPSWVIGQTKTPAAAVVRNRVLSAFGYRTMLGTAEITEKQAPNETYLRPYFQMYFDGYRSYEGMERGLRFVEPTEISPYIPDLQFGVEVNPQISAQFGELVRAQRELGDTKTAILPLISITNDLYIATQSYLEKEAR